MQAVEKELSELARYPDGGGFALKQALAAHYRVEESRIVLGSGSNDVLELVAHVFLAPGADPETDRAVRLQPQINALLQQDMHDRAALDASQQQLLAVAGG